MRVRICLLQEKISLRSLHCVFGSKTVSSLYQGLQIQWRYHTRTRLSSTTGVRNGRSTFCPKPENSNILWEMMKLKKLVVKTVFLWRILVKKKHLKAYITNLEADSAFTSLSEPPLLFLTGKRLRIPSARF